MKNPEPPSPFTRQLPNCTCICEISAVCCTVCIVNTRLCCTTAKYELNLRHLHVQVRVELLEQQLHDHRDVDHSQESTVFCTVCPVCTSLEDQLDVRNSVEEQNLRHSEPCLCCQQEVHHHVEAVITRLSLAQRKTPPWAGGGTSPSSPVRG